MFQIIQLGRRIVFCLHTVGWLVGFYGVSTFVGYLTPNSVYMDIHLTKDF